MAIRFNVADWKYAKITSEILNYTFKNLKSVRELGSEDP